MKSASLRELEIRPAADDPFKDDLLDRRELVESVAGALDSFRESHVVAISGGYGTGKTTVLRLLEVLLRQRGFGVAVLDAWEQDHQHPLESLLSAAGRAFGDGGWKSGLKEAAKAVLPEIAGELGPPGARNLGQQFLRRLMPDSPPLEEFRRLLEAAVEGNGRMVFLVDELDRCRPDHAVGILEWSKHAFSVEGVHFVFGVHLDQLSHTVKKLYGDGFEGRDYLDRLIHMAVRLPQASVRALVEREIKRRRVSEILGRLDKRSPPHSTIERLRDYLVEAKPSARVAIRAVALFDSTLRMLPEEGNRRPFIFVLTMLVILKAIAPLSYRRLLSGEATDLDVIRDLEQAGFLTDPRCARMLAWFQAYISHAHREIAWDLGSELGHVGPTPFLLRIQGKADEGDEHAALVLECESSLSEQARGHGLGTPIVLKRIEWLASF